MTEDDRERIEALCIERFGTAPERIDPIPAGLGLRRFYRLLVGARDGPTTSVVARIDVPEDPAGRPAGVPPEPPLSPILQAMRRAKLPVPELLAESQDGQVLLLEDVGDTTLDRLAQQDPARAEVLLREVVMQIPELQRICDPGGLAAFTRRLDAPLFAYKARLFARYSLPQVLGRPATPSEHDIVARAFNHIAVRCLAAPQRLAHRDLQSRNLMIDRGRVRWIDLQGAFLAPPEYDLVCLLRDSYVTWPESLVDRLLEEVRLALPDAPEDSVFRERFDLLTLTRKGKDHARYHYVAEERGDPSALGDVPATTAHLKRAAGRLQAGTPELAELLRWICDLPDLVEPRR